MKTRARSAGLIFLSVCRGIHGKARIWSIASIITAALLGGCSGREIAQTIHSAYKAVNAPYSWRDGRGNWVNALADTTIEGKRPISKTVSLQHIRSIFAGGTGFAFVADKGDIDYVATLTLGEREEFFRALQAAIADTGIARYQLSFRGSDTHCVYSPPEWDDGLAGLSC